MDTLCLGFLYFGNSLRSITRESVIFRIKTRLKDGFGECSIRMFSQCSFDPYYDHMLHYHGSQYNYRFCTSYSYTVKEIENNLVKQLQLII